MGFRDRAFAELRRRLARGSAEATRSAPGIGPAYAPEMAETWRELQEQVDGALKAVGSAVVATWEVGAADLGRAVLGRPDERAILDRYSDALVPTLAPFQDLHKAWPGAHAQGARDAERDPTLRALCLPLVRLVAGLDARVGEGWGKTCAYLVPVVGEGVDLAGAGARIGLACRDAEGTLRERLGRLPSAESLEEGVMDAAEAWQHELSRELEIELHARCKAIVAAVSRGGAT